MPIIESIKARHVLDSRGNPTVEAKVFVNNCWFRAIVPSGASTGKHEAVELRDNKRSWHGKSVDNAVKNINTIIAKKINGYDITQQKAIDKTMCQLDGTKNKHKLGANATLAVSLACARAAAAVQNMHLFHYLGSLAEQKPHILPVPHVNVINGGLHAGKKNDFQEHMLMPIGAKTYSKGLQMATECYHELRVLLNKKRETTLVGDEGGFVPNVQSVEERLTLMQNAVTSAGYAVHKDIVFSVDCAASEFYNQKTKLYHIGHKVYDSYRLSLFYQELCKQFPIASIEDPFAEDDWHAWHEFKKTMGKKIQIVGDDLLVTNKERIQKAVKQNACNALLLKVNQIGTLTEALEAAALAKKHKWNVVVSHRSGDTEDSFIADLAVGINAGQCKFGAPARSERTAKYNQLLRIEEALGNKAKYGVSL